MVTVALAPAAVPLTGPTEHMFAVPVMLGTVLAFVVDVTAKVD
jgi:hypothetical protein